jgi:hypothetical protein
MYKSFASIVLLATQAQAWWDKGHLIVARVAYDILEAEDPTALAGANALLAVLQADSDIQALNYENKYPFVECAPFADTIKGQGYSFQADWHFVNTPYLDESKDINDYNFPSQDYENVTNAIKDINLWMLGSAGYAERETYTNIMKYFENENEAKSFALRLLIHYIGDSHQPCHSITKVDSKYPTGDRGCNSEYLPSREGASNLHAVWDSVVYEEPGKQTLPFSSDNWTTYGAIAQEFSSKWPVAKSDYKTADPQGWADENMAIAQYLYDPVTEGKALFDDYVTSAANEAEKRISFAGRRMAEMMKTYFGATTVSYIQ